MVTWDERMEELCTFGEVLNFLIMSYDGAVFPPDSHVLPLLPHQSSGGGDVVLDGVAEHQLGRGHVGCRVRGVSVDEEGSAQLVRVQVTIGRKIVLDQTLGTLDTNFGPFV